MIRKVATNTVAIVNPYANTDIIVASLPNIENFSIITELLLIVLSRFSLKNTLIINANAIRAAYNGKRYLPVALNSYFNNLLNI